MWIPPQLVGLLLLAAEAPRAEEPSLYQRALARALERAQERLVASIDLHVDHSRWEDPWVVSSAHYEVRTTESYAYASTLAQDLEFMRDEFVKLLGEGRANTAPFRVWIFPTLAAYNKFGNDFGAEHSSFLGSFYSSDAPDLPVVSYRIPDRTQLGMWVTHSCLHQFLEQDFGTQPPVWVSEGLASYFALYWSWDYGARELKRLISERQFVPLKELVDAPLPAYARNPHARFIELGMLFHYLLNTCEDTRNGDAGEGGLFQEYLRLCVRGQSTRDSEFEPVFRDALELLEEDFKDHDFSSR